MTVSRFGAAKLRQPNELVPRTTTLYSLPYYPMHVSVERAMNRIAVGEVRPELVVLISTN